MATIEVDTPAGPIPGTLELPAGAGPWPGVVIVHDAFGHSSDFDRIARKFADNGFVALAPDLYARGGFVRCIRQVARDLTKREGRTIDDLLASRDALAARDDVSSVGIAGFCLGGGFALAMAPKGFGASAPFYGVMPWDLDEALDGACPIVASFGKNDITLRGAEDKLVATLDAKRIPHDTKTYPGAGHGFANKLEPALVGALLKVVGFGYKQDQSEDAFRRVFDFFGEHLKN